MSEPTDKELHALIEVIESDYDRSSGPGEAWSVEGLAQRILESGFSRAGAASHPTAADVAELLAEADTYPWNELSVVQDLVAALRAQANLNPPAPVQVVPDQLKLDPEPWRCTHGKRFSIEPLACGRSRFVPGAKFSQDRTAYGLPTEEQR